MSYFDDPEDLSQEQQSPVSVRDYLAQRLSQQDQALKSAQDQSAQERGMVGVASGVGQIIAGMSRTGDNSFNPEPYKALNAQAEQPVQDFLQRQKAKTAGIQDAASEQKLEQNADALDPNSTRSKMVQEIFKKYNPNLTEPFAAADAGTLEKLEAVNEMSKTRKEIAAGNRGTKQLLDQQRADAELGSKRSQLGSRGGNAKYVDALRRAKNIESLLNQYPDLDKMPKEQVNLLYSEIDSMVNGGAPTIAGTHGITPSTYLSELNQLLAKVGNEQVGAKLRKFLEPMHDYTYDVAENARQHLKNENGKLINAFKGRLAPDAYQRHMGEVDQEYLTPERRKPMPGTSPTAPAGKSPLSPYADPEKEKRYQEWKRQQGAQ